MFKVQFLPSNKECRLQPGRTLLEAAGKARVALSRRCGGNGQCLTCKVIVSDQSRLSKPNEKETRMLGDQLIEQGYRLACQSRVQGETVVRLPESRLASIIRSQLEQNQSGNEDER